jgi:hypothetical protein
VISVDPAWRKGQWHIFIPVGLKSGSFNDALALRVKDSADGFYNDEYRTQ